MHVLRVVKYCLLLDQSHWEVTLDGIVTLGSIRARFFLFFETENWITNLRNFHYKHDSIMYVRYIFIYIYVYFSLLSATVVQETSLNLCLQKVNSVILSCRNGFHGRLAANTEVTKKKDESASLLCSTLHIASHWGVTGTTTYQEK